MLCHWETNRYSWKSTTNWVNSWNTRHSLLSRAVHRGWDLITLKHMLLLCNSTPYMQSLPLYLVRGLKCNRWMWKVLKPINQCNTSEPLVKYNVKRGLQFTNITLFVNSSVCSSMLLKCVSLSVSLSDILGILVCLVLFWPETHKAWYRVSTISHFIRKLGGGWFFPVELKSQ